MEVRRAADRGDVEVVLLEPGRNLRDVVRRGAEAVRVLFGRQPAVIVGRGRVLLRSEQPVEVRLLFRRLAKDQRDWRQGFGRVHRADIVLGLCPRVNVPVTYERVLCPESDL